MASKSDFPQEIEKERWVLAFLYAPMEGQNARPISYPTDFSLGMFLLERKLIQELDKDQLYAFIPSKYMPRSELLGEMLLELENRGCIKRRPSEDDDFTIELTKDGVWKAKEAYDSLQTFERDFIDFVKNEQLTESEGYLYSFIYSSYPEFVNPTLSYNPASDETTTEFEEKPQTTEQSPQNPIETQ
jgi:hypothetical protein